MGGAEGKEAVGRNEESILKGQEEQKNVSYPDTTKRGEHRGRSLWKMSQGAQAWVFLHGEGTMTFPTGPLSPKAHGQSLFLLLLIAWKGSLQNAPAVAFLHTSVE